MRKAEKYLQQWNQVDRSSYISSTKDQLNFLASVVKYPSLVQGDHLTNAIRRYEMYWLPLCKKHGTMSCDEWAAPLDIAWVWYLHMLLPEHYVNDCICLIGNAPNHALKSGKALQTATSLTKDLWEQSYADKEPYEVNLDKPVGIQEYKPKLKHDFHLHSTRHRNFYYQVSLPHYLDDKFLDASTQRYVTHLGLQMKNPSFDLSLPVDVQLVMYSHQLNPIFYNYQINVILGKTTSPLYLMDSIENMTRQYQIDMATKKIWDEADHEFYKPGTLYRGEPSILLGSNNQAHDGTDRFGAMLRQEYSLSVTKMDLKNLDHACYLVVFEGPQGEEIYKAKVKVDEEKFHNYFSSMGSENGVEYVQLEDFPSEKRKAKSKSKISGFTHPMYSLLDDTQVQTQDTSDNSPTDNITHTIGDGHSTLVHINTNKSDPTKVKVSLYQLDKSRLHASKVLIGESNLDVFKFVEPKDFKPSVNGNEKKKQQICLPLEFPCSGPQVRVTLSVALIGCGHYMFQVSPEYGFFKFRHISAALTYPTMTLPLSIITAPETHAEVITYPILDYRGEKTFTCRVVRSIGAATDVFYAIEILDNEGCVVATSHLLSSDALPYKQHLASPQRCAYFSADKEENAMLIRGQEDWGLCIGRKVTLPHFGKGNPTVLALRLFLLRNDSANCSVRKFKNSLYMFKIPSSEQHKSYIYLHLSEGKVIMSSDVTAVPEVLALALSSLVLQYLFCEKDRDCWAIIDGEDTDLFSIFQSNDNFGFAWDGNYDGGEGGEDNPCSFVSEIDC